MALLLEIRGDTREISFILRVKAGNTVIASCYIVPQTRLVVFPFAVQAATESAPPSLEVRASKWPAIVRAVPPAAAPISHKRGWLTRSEKLIIQFASPATKQMLLRNSSVKGVIPDFKIELKELHKNSTDYGDLYVTMRKLRADRGEPESHDVCCQVEHAPGIS